LSRSCLKLGQELPVNPVARAVLQVPQMRTGIRRRIRERQYVNAVFLLMVYLL
jgi:hypothetical protein